MSDKNTEHWLCHRPAVWPVVAAVLRAADPAAEMEKVVQRAEVFDWREYAVPPGGGYLRNNPYERPKQPARKHKMRRWWGDDTLEWRVVVDRALRILARSNNTKIAALAIGQLL
jgi:hypothetical protein